MKIGICAANLTDCPLPEDLSYIGVDRGAEKLLELGITPAFAIGDFDSIIHPQLLKTISSVKTLPSRKDETDTHAAVQWAVENGYDEIYIYGATGGRLDHFLAVLILLERFRDINIYIIDSQNLITLLAPGAHKIFPDGYKYFSIYATDRAKITITGAEYNAKDLVLLRNNPLGCSNQIKEGFAEIITDADILLVKSKDAPGQ